MCFGGIAVILRYTEDTGGRTVYHVLRNTFHASDTFVRRLRRTEAVRVNGTNVFTTARLAPGDLLTVDVLAAEPYCTVIPEIGSLDVLREDDGLLWINKPSGLLAHPSHSRMTGTLLNYVCGRQVSLCGNPCAHAVNRLDRDTSGVMLFSKNAYMKDRAERALLSATSCKEYLALVSHPPSPSSGIIDAPIRRFRSLDMRRIVAPDGQSAITLFETLRVFPEGFALVRLRLETGRTHQIRVHMLYLGSPLLGDRLYGTEDSLALSSRLGVTAQALHAARLSIPHPITDEIVTVFAPVHREDLLRLVPKLEMPEFFWQNPSQ